MPANLPAATPSWATKVTQSSRLFRGLSLSNSIFAPRLTGSYGEELAPAWDPAGMCASSGGLGSVTLALAPATSPGQGPQIFGMRLHMAPAE